MVLEEVETYVLRLQNTIAQYIATHTVLEMSMEEEKLTVEQVTWRCRKQRDIDLNSAKTPESAAEAETEEWMEGEEYLAETREQHGGVKVATKYHRDGA